MELYLLKSVAFSNLILLPLLNALQHPGLSQSKIRSLRSFASPIQVAKTQALQSSPQATVQPLTGTGLKGESGFEPRYSEMEYGNPQSVPTTGLNAITALELGFLKVIEFIISQCPLCLWLVYPTRLSFYNM